MNLESDEKIKNRKKKQEIKISSSILDPFHFSKILGYSMLFKSMKKKKCNESM